MKVISAMFIALLFTLNSGNLMAQHVCTNSDKVANNGYDLVNYFVANSAVRGSSEFSPAHEGATYYFANAENLNTFKANPGNFLPQIDGFCSFAVAKMNKKVPVDPTTFRIDDGKLYLFYNDLWEGKPFNTIIPWLNHEAEMEKIAQENWVALKSEN